VKTGSTKYSTSSNSSKKLRSLHGSPILKLKSNEENYIKDNIAIQQPKKRATDSLVRHQV